jgi:hypothetical protein
VSGFTTLNLNARGTPNPSFELDVGSVLQRTFSTWIANLVPFSVVGLLVYLPALIAYGVLAVFGGHILLVTLVKLLEAVLSIALTGAITYGVFQHLRGQQASVNDLISTGFSHVGAVFLTGLLAGFAITLGFLLFCVPGLIVMTMFWVAQPVAVMENPGATASLSRSSDLTSGNRWSVFAIALVVGLATGGVSVVIQLAISAILGIPSGTTVGSQKAVSEILGTLLLVPLHCLGALAPAVVYHDLRVGKEGIEIDELVRVFE